MVIQDIDFILFKVRNFNQSQAPIRVNKDAKPRKYR